MKEDYISFETAKLLKEKGFNEKCNSFYRKTLVNNKLIDKEELYFAGRLFLTNSELQEKSYEQVIYCTAPTLQMVMKWLREKHNIHIILSINWLYFANTLGWMYTITKILENGVDYIDSKGDENDKTFYSSYEEATEAAIKYCLKNLI